MTSAIAIITYGRRHALEETLKGIQQFCPQYPLAVFEDCAQRDSTESFLTAGGTATGDGFRPELLAHHVTRPFGSAYLGTENLGVAGNSNRAIKWFMDTGCDHLCLLNDDLHILGDFVNFYREAHETLEVGMFSFCDFTHHPSYRWMTLNCRGVRVKVCPRMTGIMMSFTREVVNQIGYFDTRFGKFGQEHCDYMNRARLARFQDLDGQPQSQLDLEMKVPLLRHQDVETSVVGAERQVADQHANAMIQQIAPQYGVAPIYRPYALKTTRYVGGTMGCGIPVDNLPHYRLIDSSA